jgi:serine/threonine-protein kinase
VANEEEPQKYGKCLIEREIGRGARSIVYLAWHEGLQIPVAVKVMKKEEEEDDEQFAERFMREARIAAQLTHTNIVRVYDCGETPESYYLVLEYIEGESCKDRMARLGAFAWQDAARIVREVADGLNYAKQKGVIHRDLKPENIMLDSTEKSRMADLGLAKEIAPGQASATADGDVLGTPYYMSPEQVRQPGEVDFRSDIYSLGATLYHMATGEVPFEAPTPFEIMTMHLSEPLPPPQQKKPDLPQALCDIITRAMAKERAERYQSYEDLLRDLDMLLLSEAPKAAGSPVEVPETAPPVAAKEEAAAERATREAEVAARLRRIKPGEMPVTSYNVWTKLLGVLALLVYAFCVVCLHQMVLIWLGAVAAAVAAAVLLGLSAACGCVVMRPVRTDPEAESPDAVSLRVSAALGWVCERIDLPTPQVRISNRMDPRWHSYCFFGRKAAIDLPHGWLERAGLSDEQMRALLAQCLAGVYDGDATLRTLLALPLGLLSASARTVMRVVNVRGSLGTRSRLRLAHGVAMAVMVAICAAIAVLFVLSIWAGLLGLVVLAMLLLASGFERHTVFASDAFAARVLDSRKVVQSLAVITGLMGLERYRLLYETMGPDVADRRSDQPVQDARDELVANIAAHYSAVTYLPDTLELARKLLSGLPAAAERLNRLVGLTSASRVIAGVGLARRVYAGMLGVGRKTDVLSMAELAEMRPYAQVGVVAGLLSVLALAFLFLRNGSQYYQFLVVLGALGATLGVLVTVRSCRQAICASRAGWAIIVSSVAFAVTTMVGFCLAPWHPLSRLALQFPVFLALVLPAAALAGALLVRISPVLGLKLGTARYDVRSRTAHTIMMPRKDEGSSPLASRREQTRAHEEDQEPTP